MKALKVPREANYDFLKGVVRKLAKLSSHFKISKFYEEALLLGKPAFDYVTTIIFKYDDAQFQQDTDSLFIFSFIF